jgi:hypothetical protein
MKPDLNRIKKLMLLTESITYTDDKIKEFLQLTINIKDRSDKSVTSYGSKIIDLSLNDINSGKINTDNLFYELSNELKFLKQKHSELLDVVEKYDYINSPEDIQNMDSLLSELDSNIMSLDELKEILDDLVSTHKRLLRYNKNLFFTDSTIN